MLLQSVAVGLASLVVLATAAPAATSAAAALPTVDLGYQLHKAIAYNVGELDLSRVGLFIRGGADHSLGHRQILQLLQYSLCPTSRWQPAFPRAQGAGHKSRRRARRP